MEFFNLESFDSLWAVSDIISRLGYGLIAMVLVCVLGGFTGALFGNANPALWFVLDKAFGRIGNRLYKPERLQADLAFRGAALLCVVLALLLLVVAAAAEVLAAFHDTAHFVPAYEIVLLCACLTAGSVWRAMARLQTILSGEQPVQGAYYAIAYSLRYDLNSTDDYGATRAGLALSVHRFCDSFVLPVFWYIAFGLPGLIVACGIAAFVWRFAQQGSSKGYGAPAIALYRLVAVVPQMLCALCLMIAVFVSPTARTHKAISALCNPLGWPPLAQGGAAMAMMAYALEVSLGGPVKDVGGHTLSNRWVGPEGASAKTARHHLRRGIVMIVAAHLVFMLAVSSLYIFLSGL